MVSTGSQHDSMDELEHEDRVLQGLFYEIARHSGHSIEERYAYGNAAKQVIRHAAVREACVVDLLDAADPSVSDLLRGWRTTMTTRRSLLNAVNDASRGVQGLYLRTASFDGLLGSLVHELQSEIARDLTAVVPGLRSAAHPFTRPPRSARFAMRHAPTRLRVGGPGWIEHSAIASRLATVWDHLHDYPRAAREARVA